MPYDTPGMTDADGNPVSSTAGTGSGYQSASGYTPDMLHRILDAIGGSQGSPSGGSRVLDWLGSQFGGTHPGQWGQGAGQAPQSAQDAWYNAVANSPSPFGGTPYGPDAGQQQAPAPQYKPVTKISSAADIAKRVSDMIGPPPSDMPPPGPGSGMPMPQQGNNPDFNMGPLPPQNAMVTPADLGIGPPPAAHPMTQRPGAHRPSLAGLIPHFGGAGLPGDYPGVEGDSAATGAGSPFSLPAFIKNYMPQLRASGGPIHGWMRGGYPDVYGSGPPIRHTFDSGGQNYVNGYGDSDGRADDVNAKLSPKEYVMDAESMSMLGDGNPDAGAKKMDEMRANLRAHKGKALAQGKFSPKAKSPQEYLVGNPMGDGLRRRGRDK